MLQTSRYVPVAFVAILFGNVVHSSTLELSTVDESGEAIPCRILVRASDGRCAVPDGATTLQTGPDQWFISPGQCRVEIPKGDTTLRVEHGTEFVRIKERIHIDSDSVLKTFSLRRWIDLRKRGYLCGENHVHVDTVHLAPMLAAEGLDFGTSLTWWRGPDSERPVPAGEGRIRLLEYASRQVPTSVYDAELEYTWGAAYIQNLPAPMPLAEDRHRPNLDYVRHAVDTGAIVHYQGGWSREVLLDALPDLNLPRFSNDDLAELLPEICFGLRSLDDLRNADWLSTIQAKVGYDRLAEIDRLAPAQFELTNGNRHAIVYEAGKPPVLAVRIQEMFGVAETPRIAAGRVPLVLHLLGPNHRPQQVTADLASFWRNGYPEVKKELRRRYPKHSWPDDPLTTPATRSGLKRDAK